MGSAQSKGGRRRKNAVPDGQLPLPLQDHGLQAVHPNPLVADATKRIHGRRPSDDAWAAWEYVESNPPHLYAGMFFDIDDPDRWENEVDGPLPNWQIRKDTGPATYHVAYTLEIPVARHDAALLQPLAFYRDVYDGLALKIGADFRYSGLMTKNPLYPPPDCSAQWYRKDPYTLTELREWLPLVIPKPLRETGVGRNEDLFRHCIKLAHQPRWARIIADEGHAGRWLDHVRVLNVQEFAEDPLPDVECRSIAKSCAKYSLRNFSEDRFSEIQAKRGARRAQQRWHPGDPEYDYQARAETAASMVRLGYHPKDVAIMFGVTRRTIERDLVKVKNARTAT